MCRHNPQWRSQALGVGGAWPLAGCRGRALTGCVGAKPPSWKNWEKYEEILAKIMLFSKVLC